MTDSTRRAIAHDYSHLSEGQRTAVGEILASRDQVVALEGTAGAGKTTALTAVRDAAEREGYQVEGFAPTSRAAHKLTETGIASSTLQRQLARGEEEARTTDQKRLYVLDESSLASTKQMHTFLTARCSARARSIAKSIGYPCWCRARRSPVHRIDERKALMKGQLGVTHVPG